VTLRRSLPMEALAVAAVAAAALDTFRPSVALVTRLLVLVWAVLPVLTADRLDLAVFRRGSGAKWTERGGAILAIAPCLLASSFVFGLVRPPDGWAEIDVLLLFAFWLAGFGLRDGGAAALHELLGYVTLGVAIFRGSAQPVPLAAASVVGFTVASALRRRPDGAGLRDEFARIDTRSAWKIGLLAAVVLALLVFAVSLALGPRAPRRPDAPVERERIDPATKRPGRDDRPERAGRNPGAEPESGEDAGGADVSDTDGLSLLAAPGGPRGDDAPVIVLRPVGGARAEDSSAIGPDTLFRARTLVRFDLRTETWSAPAADLWSIPDARGGTLVRAGVEASGSPELWRAKVATGRVDAVPVPYGTLRLMFPPGAVLEPAPDDDVVIVGGLRRDEDYTIQVGVQDARAPLGPGDAVGEPSSAAELDLPVHPMLRHHLATLARAHLDPANSLDQKIARLTAYFAATYGYDAHPAPDQAPSGIAHFMMEKRVGDCRHLATACALMLRAAGVPARLAKGHAGADDLSPEAGGLAIWASSAHVWVEVLSDRGWIPIDPTEWVAPRRDRAADARAERDQAFALRNRVPFWLILGLLGLMLWGGGLLVRFLARWIKARRGRVRTTAEPDVGPERAPPVFAPRSPAERLLVLYARLNRDLEVTGNSRRRHETPREHARRVGAGGAPESAFATLTPLLDDGLYGKVDLTDDDIAPGETAITDLRKRLG
jgi:transglutaminase-like putative cysteine protease